MLNLENLSIRLAERRWVCRVCPNAIRIIRYAVQKLNTVPTLQRWLALRVSYGMNGILLRSEHLTSLGAYMRWATWPPPCGQLHAHTLKVPGTCTAG